MATGHRVPIQTSTTSCRSGFLPPTYSISTDELHDRLLNDPATTVAELAQAHGHDNPFTGPTWYGSAGALQELITVHPEDALIVLGLPTADVGENPMTALLDPVLSGFVLGSPTADVCAMLLQRLDELLEPGDRARSIALALEALSRADFGVLTNDNLVLARRDAPHVWDGLSGDATDLGEPLMTAINHPAGQLAEFWLQTISIEWKAAGADWKSLTNPGEPPSRRCCRIPRITDTTLASCLPVSCTSSLPLTRPGQQRTCSRC